ncbi:MAG: hypothetical protein EA397_20330 [Deltaproteobacteria bacterium]|nr:MAG: hypothetical protein EA397_20330 [Deltaproteobacteria bacterium]
MHRTHEDTLWEFDLSSPRSFADSFAKAASGAADNRAAISPSQLLANCLGKATNDERQTILEAIQLILEEGDRNLRSQALHFIEGFGNETIVEQVLGGLVQRDPPWLNDADPRFLDKQPLGRVVVETTARALGQPNPEVLHRLRTLGERYGGLYTVFLTQVYADPLAPSTVDLIAKEMVEGESPCRAAQVLAVLYRTRYREGLERVARAMRPAPSDAKRCFFETVMESASAPPEKLREWMDLQG